MIYRNDFFSFNSLSLIIGLLLTSTFVSCSKSPVTGKLFNGENLQGWEGSTEFFKVKDQAIVAGRLDDIIPQNYFLCTTKEYQDFELLIKAKVVGEGDNGGVQFRSKRIDNSNEVSGYQADIGFIPTSWVKHFDEFEGITDSLDDNALYPLWGSLYDESRRSKILSLGNFNLVSSALVEDDWNELKIKAYHNNIKIWLNDSLISDYSEKEDVPRKGIIGLQVHAGPPLEVWYKDIFIKEL